MQFTAKKNIGGRREIVAQGEILVDNLDAVLPGLHRLVENKFLIVHAHRAVAWAKISGHHLDQGGLSFRAGGYPKCTRQLDRFSVADTLCPLV